MRLGLSTAVAAVFAICAGAAQAAEETAVNSGAVTEMVGPEGSVLVLRGNTTYTLAAGDTLFEGDTVFTRTNGSATLTLDGCVIELDKASSIIVNDQSCTVPPVKLASTDVIGGYEIAAGGAGVGATPSQSAASTGRGADPRTGHSDPS